MASAFKHPGDASLATTTARGSAVLLPPLHVCQVVDHEILLLSTRQHAYKNSTPFGKPKKANGASSSPVLCFVFGTESLQENLRRRLYSRGLATRSTSPTDAKAVKRSLQVLPLWASHEHFWSLVSCVSGSCFCDLAHTREIVQS